MCFYFITEWLKTVQTTSEMNYVFVEYGPYIIRAFYTNRYLNKLYKFKIFLPINWVLTFKFNF
jgi:hypothetical protein